MRQASSAASSVIDVQRFAEGSFDFLQEFQHTTSTSMDKNKSPVPTWDGRR